MNTDDWVEGSIFFNSASEERYVSIPGVNKRLVEKNIFKVKTTDGLGGVITLKIPQVMGLLWFNKRDANGNTFPGWSVRKTTCKEICRRPGHLYLLLG